MTCGEKFQMTVKATQIQSENWNETDQIENKEK